MKCPYNIPLEAYYGTLSKMWLVKDAEGKVLFFDLTEAKADYIVTAINSYEKSAEAIDEIEAVSCGEKQIECDGVYDDSDGLLWIYKRIQALKEAEKQ